MGENARALVIEFSRNCKLSKKEHRLQFFGDQNSTKLIKRYVGGPNAQSNLLGHVIETDAIWFNMVIDKSNISDIRIQFELCPVPSDFSLACWMVDVIIRKMKQIRTRLWKKILIGALGGLGKLLCIPKLSTLLRHPLFQLLNRGLAALKEISAKGEKEKKNKKEAKIEKNENFGKKEYFEKKE